jgi:CubicO group peptidase (beta-lactamase class C family)
MRQATGFRRAITGLLGLLLALLVLASAGLLYFGIPHNAAGMAAKGICSAAFVAGRPHENLMAQDVLPASPVLALISVKVDEATHSVSARFAGLFERRAVLLTGRGCVLDLEPEAKAKPYTPTVDASQPWPRGEAALPTADWTGVDKAKLEQVAQDAFIGAGDPLAGNARGLAVVQHGRLLVLRNAPGFAPGTGLHGWSMTKTVTGMLAYKLALDAGLPLEGAVVDAFPAGRAPAWVLDWRGDARQGIKVSDLFFMRDGLASTEDYQPWGSVPHMLWGESDTAAWAAGHASEAAPGTRWRYLSATANLLGAVARGRFASDADYWAYPRQALFEPIGARSAVLETDQSGNWVGSSYLWASVGDWARLGQLMLQDGQWDGKQVLPAGWLKLAGTPSQTAGPGRGYGAMSWRYGDPQAGECRGFAGVPADTVVMGGHWGQIVAVVPSKDAVVVRLGWTFKRGQFDACTLLSDTLAALP